jgi:thioredoxin:protein disulfide reductase
VAVKLGYRNVYRDPIGFPEWQQMGLPIVASPAGLTTPLQSAAAPADASPLKGWAMLWTLLGVFAGGLALNLTPCVALCALTDSRRKLCSKSAFF